MNPFRQIRPAAAVRADITAKQAEIGQIESARRGSEKALAVRKTQLERLRSELALCESSPSATPQACPA